MTRLGSTINDTDTWTPEEGLLSDNYQNYFKDWSMYHLRYCDGTGHQGYAKDPIKYKGK